MKKQEFIEVLANIIKDRMNDKGFEFCIDFDSNQSFLIEFGRKIAGEFHYNCELYKAEKVYEKNNKTIKEGFKEGLELAKNYEPKKKAVK